MKRGIKKTLGLLVVEVYAFLEFCRFSIRHRRYLTTALSLYIYSFISFRHAHRLRIGYAVLQHLDDVLDGDRLVSINPIDYVNEITAGIKIEKSQRFKRMKKLVNYFLGCIENTKFKAIDGKSNFDNLVDAMKFDYKRRQEKLVLCEADLENHHFKTFYSSVNLTLILCESMETADSELELVHALSWCSPMRDIEDDYKVGIINIPAEVIEESKDENKNVFSSQCYLKWKDEQFYKVVEVFNKFELKEKKFKLSVFFMHALKAFAKKYKKREGIVGEFENNNLEQIKSDYGNL